MFALLVHPEDLAGHNRMSGAAGEAIGGEEAHSSQGQNTLHSPQLLKLRWAVCFELKLLELLLHLKLLVHGRKHLRRPHLHKPVRGRTTQS